MEADTFPYPGFHTPITYGRVCHVRCVYPVEHVVVGLAPFTHQLHSLGSEVKIFKPVCLLLVENNTSEIVLRINIFPFEIYDVAPAQACQTGKQKRPFDGGTQL